MGIIWSRFKRKDSTKEILKNIQLEIEKLEDYNEKTEQTRRKLIMNLLASCTVIYIAVAIVFYFNYLSSSLDEQLLYAAIFVASLWVIYIIKTFLTCYYKWKLRRNEKKLLRLKGQKEEMLDQVMETETYKVAKDILETFAPEQIRKASMTIKSPIAKNIPKSNQPNMPVVSPVGDGTRRRIVSPSSYRTYVARPSTPLSPPNYPSSVTTFSSRNSMSPRQTAGVSTDLNNASLSTPAGMAATGRELPPGPPMPRPILPRERSVLDRFIEYLVGDGPSNRFALVCRQCESHNGMALKEEFPYIAFRCAYCFYWNPARKQRPKAPKLETSLGAFVDHSGESSEESAEENKSEKLLQSEGKEILSNCSGSLGEGLNHVENISQEMLKFVDDEDESTQRVDQEKDSDESSVAHLLKGDPTSGQTEKSEGFDEAQLQSSSGSVARSESSESLPGESLNHLKDSEPSSTSPKSSQN